MPDKLDGIKHSAELLAEKMEARKEAVLQTKFNLLRRALVDILGLAGAITLIVATDGLVWVVLALLIGGISAYGLFWKVVGSL